MLKAISLKWLYIRLKTAHTSTLMCGYKDIRHFAVAVCRVAHIFYHTMIYTYIFVVVVTHSHTPRHIWMNSVCWIKIFEQIKSQQQRLKKEFYSFLLFYFYFFGRLLCTHCTHSRTHTVCFDIYYCWRVYFTILLYCCRANLMYGRKPQQQQWKQTSNRINLSNARMYLLHPYLFFDILMIECASTANGNKRAP